MTPDLGTTNVWLAVLAVASALQTALLLGGAIGGYLVYRKTSQAIDRLEQRHLEPISARVSLMMDDIQDMTARARRVDDVVRAKLNGVEGAVREVGHVVGDRLWPVVGIARAVRAGMRAFTVKPPAPVVVPGRANRAATL